MKNIIIILFVAITLSAQVKIEEAFPNLSFDRPVEIISPNDNTNRLFVLSQSGKIFSFEAIKTIENTNLFLDIESDVLSGGELGLLGLAFHPDFVENNLFYLYYNVDSPRRSIISKMSVKSSNPNEADLNSEEILLEIEQPYSNHNGGKIAFGLDGYLYISLGDGGSGGDPDNNGQNLSTLLGSFLRIDIDSKSNGRNYLIPDDNPFINNPSAKHEIYAYGLRNVWKFSFDFQTNKLWAADVGQNKYEEINIIEKGGNYGWRLMEGFHCYNPSNCDQSGLALPLHEYEHNDLGGYSITGGYVYRGNEAEELFGKYIYGDFVTGNIWALKVENGEVISNERIFDTNYSIAAFGEDEKKNLYFSSFGSGKIYKISGTPATSVKEGIIPTEFQLFQNFPNPFNPTTIIEYSILSNEHISLKVYDVLGNEIATLINKVQSAGSYQAAFDASNFTSGVYYYKLETDNFSSVKKMILLK